MIVVISSCKVTIVSAMWIILTIIFSSNLHSKDISTAHPTLGIENQLLKLTYLLLLISNSVYCVLSFMDFIFSRIFLCYNLMNMHMVDPFFFLWQ